MSKKERIQWEPYKAATNSVKLKLNSFKSGTGASSMNDVDKNSLIRYKVDTDLDLFNAQRPGYKFDEYDFKMIDKISEVEIGKLIKLDESKSPPSPPTTPFIDARFYTDFHFLKLANDLKRKCVNDATLKTSPTNKPVNVVGPLIEKKLQQDDKLMSSKQTISNSSVVDSNSARIWKTQRNQYESRISYLESQMNGLNEQLQIQTQVNSELKKMLVASVGEDMQYKLERLVNDRQRLEFELTSNKSSIDKMSEEIEQISIQCDLWRSKFLASKLMCEELSTWKSFLLLLNKENENVVRNLLNENNLINEKLLKANDLALQLNNHANKTQESSSKSSLINRYNNIHLGNSIVAQLNQLKTSLSATKSSEQKLFEKSARNGKDYKFKTNNEIIAEQVLEQFDWLNQMMASKKTNDEANLIDSFDKLEKLVSRIKMKRQSTYGRLYQSGLNSDSNLLINVCRNCTGEIKVV